ncbi:MAG: mechanosensitive ion channel family protein [Gammaproteobacteria bacterium]
MSGAGEIWGFMQDARYFEWLGWAGASAWMAQVFLVVLCALLGDFLLRRALKKVLRKLEKTPNPWDDALLAALRRPASLLIWVLGMTIAMDVIRLETQAGFFAINAPLRQAGVIIALTWFLIRLTRRAQQIFIARPRGAQSRADATTFDAIGKLLRASILIIAALVLLQTLGFRIAGILAFGGIGGIAIGFAARDLLANFFGGLMLYLDRPFAVGDWVRSPDRDIEGTVEHIGWRLTRIRAFDMRPIYVPNGAFLTMAIVNPSRMSHRQIYETIGLRYRDAGKIAVITAEIKAMLAAHPDIDRAQTAIVHFNRFAPSSLDFFLYAYTKTIEWARYHEIKQDVLLRVHGIITAHGAEVAFPTSTLRLPDAVRVAAAAETPAHGG